MPTIHRYLDLSTAHLDGETAELLNGGHRLVEGDVVYGPVFLQVCSNDDSEEYGWLMPVLEQPEFIEAEKHYPQCIRDCLALARRHECNYIRFDRDGEVAEELPVYDW